MTDIAPAEALYPNGPSKAMGNDPVGDDNFRTALNKMNLSPQEQYLYKMHLNNLKGKGGVDNPDGTRSSLLQTSVEVDGKHYNIPTVWEGKILSPKEAMDRVDKIGWDRFPSYKTADEAEARYTEMHKYMEADTTKFLSNRGR